VGLAFFTDPDGLISADSHQLVLMGPSGPSQDVLQGREADGKLLQLQKGCTAGDGCLNAVFAMLSGIVGQMQVRCALLHASLLLWTALRFRG
jgi:hypothetical protein